MPFNCSTTNDHHCAKQFKAQVLIEGCKEKPILNRDDMPPMNTSGPGKYKHGFVTMKIYVGGEDTPRFLQLGIDTEASYDTKKMIGLQICRPSLKQDSGVQWDANTQIATISLLLRVRLIRQRTSCWEFHDDAGSGSRGKSHDRSRLRFSARLLKNNKTTEYEPALCQIPGMRCCDCICFRFLFQG